MAELQESNATIVPVPKELGMAQGDMGRYQLGIKEYDAAGRATEFAISLSMDDPKWGPRIQTAAILKQSPQWKAAAFPYIIYAVMYAENLGLDVMAGDVFDVGGRLATSNKAKIKRALASGNIEGIETTTVELDAPGPDKCVAKKDLECTVTVHVKGWKHPIVRRARLSRWYKGSNPNWRDNPEHMLEMNTTAHACEYVVPGGTEGDEAPPPVWQTATAATMENDLVPALKASILQVNQLKGKP